MITEFKNRLSLKDNFISLKGKVPGQAISFSRLLEEEEEGGGERRREAGGRERGAERGERAGIDQLVFLLMLFSMRTEQDVRPKETRSFSARPELEKSGFDL